MAPGPAGDPAVVAWLLDGDPAIRWQVLRDVLGEPARVWRPVRELVATEGWGARLLSCRDGGGRWTPRLYGRKWLSTTYSLLLLRQLGLPGNNPPARASCLLFLDEALWHDGGITVTTAQPRAETCVTGFVIGLLSWFGVTDPRRERVVDYLLREQLPDGGWNCMRHAGATHGSFHTTANVLDGLRDYADAHGPRHAEVLAAEARGREFFLVHRLVRSHRTGAVVHPGLLRLPFPPRWHHDVLRGLDYFRAASAPRDERLAEAVGLLTDRCGADGRWPLSAPHPGAVWFEMERPGPASRWNTLRALRVLAWWNGGR